MTTGPDWKDGFLFIGDQLALDFINTRLTVDGAPVELLADWDAVVRWFKAAGLIDDRAARKLLVEWADTPAARRTVMRLAEFRESLRAAVARLKGRLPPTRAFTLELNRELYAHPIRTRLAEHGGRMQRAPIVHIDPDELMAPLADAAAALLVDVDPSRVRQCEGCVAHFYDSSKNGLRRWCSMRICGNRAKVSRYAARQRTPAGTRDERGRR